MTQRQEAWARAAREEARRGNGFTAGLFTLLAQPSEREREHDCRAHTIGFRRQGRRGLKCGVCGTVVKWVDPA